MKKQRQSNGSPALRIAGLLLMVSAVVFLIVSVKRVVGYGDDAWKGLEAEALISVSVFANGFFLAYLGNWRVARRFISAFWNNPPFP